MSPLATQLRKSALNALYYSGAYKAFGKLWRGAGAIFTLHHVRPATGARPFHPNRILEVTPSFLEATIEILKREEIEIVSLDEMAYRLANGDFRRRFICFTLDDGYADNLTHALPVFEKYEAPFAVYVSSGLPDGTAELWWEILERAIAKEAFIACDIGGREFTFRSGSSREKYRAYRSLYWLLRDTPEREQRHAIAALAMRYSVDARELCREEALTWDQVRTLERHPLVTIGAHTADHYSLAKLPLDQARVEIERCRERLRQEIGHPSRHFAYPYGDSASARGREFDLVREFGFTTAVTTRKGVVFPEHRGHLMSLPRISLNGEYQEGRFVRMYLSGAPFALWGKFHRLDVS